MEFHRTLRLSFYSKPSYPGLLWNIPWNSMPLWSRQIRKSPSSKWFHGIRRAPLQMTKVFRGIPWNIPWNSMELWCRQMKYHLVPWNSMEIWDCHFNQYHVTLDLHGIFLGIQWKSGLAKINHRVSMGFHGIMRAPFQMTQVFHGIPWNIPWNSMELWYRQIYLGEKNIQLFKMAFVTSPPPPPPPPTPPPPPALAI